MKTIASKDEYTIIFEDKTINDLTYINNKIKEIPKTVKRVLFDLKSVKYFNSLFIDYLIITYRDLILYLRSGYELFEFEELFSKLTVDH